jgi:hypothetical protein
MKNTILYIFLGILILFSVFVIIISCSKSTIIDMAIPRNIDTSVYTPRVKSDTTSNRDTARVPISFDVSVDNWGDEEVINYSYD